MRIPPSKTTQEGFQEIGGKGDCEKPFPLIAMSIFFDEEFSIDWIQELLNQKMSRIISELEKGIQEGWLESIELGKYRFVKHAKLQVAHDFFTESQMKQIHGRIVEILLKDLPDDDRKPRILAPHLLHISNEEKGCRWLIKAGDHYWSSYQREKALQCYSKSLQDLGNLFSEEADRLLIKAAIKYSKISPASHNTIEVLSILKKAIERSKKSNNLPFEVPLRFHLAKNEWLRSHYGSALRHFEEGWTKAKELNDPKILRSVVIYKIFFLYWQGRFREAVELYEECFKNQDKEPYEFLPYLAAGMIGHCYAQIGQVTRGLGILDQIRQCSLKDKDFYRAAEAGATMGLIMLDNHIFEDALKYFKITLQDTHKHTNEVAWATAKLGLSYAYFLKGNVKRSNTILREFLHHINEIHLDVRPFPYLLELCWAMEQKIFSAIDSLSLEKEIKHALQDDNIFMKGVAYRFQANLQQQKGLQQSVIIKSLQASIKWLKQSGHINELARSMLGLARQYLVAGNENKANKAVRNAADILGSIEDDLIPEDLRPLIDNQTERETMLSEIVCVSREIVALKDTDEMLQKILVAVSRFKRVERGAMFVYDDKSSSNNFCLSVSHNFKPQCISHPDFKFITKIVEDVVASGKTVITESKLSKEAEENSYEIIRSCICVPIFSKEKVIGAMYHDNRFLPEVFQEKNIDLMTHFAALAALILENKKAQEYIQRLSHQSKNEEVGNKRDDFKDFQLDGIIGESQAIRHVLLQVAEVADTDTNVLIIGETGVGKELVARAAHRHSRRKNKLFVDVHCSALPENLIPSEMFGHEKGSFTGAIQRRIGRFELADGGTLFLDEVGDLPLEIQVRLLKVLQSKAFERVGGSDTISSDFRLVTATNRDLEQAVKAGQFREDLFYRLNVFPIYVPPLRERNEDIPLLVQYFIKKYTLKLKKNIYAVGQMDLDRMMQYDWPGNVRELENIIQRAVIISNGSQLKIPELGICHGPNYQAGSGTTLKENERNHIQWALEKTGWKVRGSKGAARLLDINPSTLEFRMKKLGIKRPGRSPND